MAMKMDLKWVRAVKIGDVEFWRKILGEYNAKLEAETNGDYEYDYSSSCFLSHYYDGGEDRGNILHLAAWEEQEEIFGEVIKSLPDRLVHLLLTQHDYCRQNPLHLAAISRRGPGMVKMIMGFYQNLYSKSELIKLEAKPWLAQDEDNYTPLDTALQMRSEECALEILEAPLLENENYKDLNELCNIVTTPLFIALENGYNRAVLHILRFATTYSFGNKKAEIFLLGRICSEEVFQLLLEKHSNLVNEVAGDVQTVLQEWVSEAHFSRLECIMEHLDDFPAAFELKRHLAYLSYARERSISRDSIFDNFARKKLSRTSKIFANIYREERAKELASTESTSQDHRLQPLPWLIPDRGGIPSLQMAMADNKIAYEEYDRLKSDLFVYESAVKGEFELLFAAIKKELWHAAEAIWHEQNNYGWWYLYPPQERQFWHSALRFSDEAAIWVTERLPYLASKDEEIEYVLRSACEIGAAKFIEWMLKKHPSTLKKAPKVWIGACNKGHFLAVKAFIDHCPYFREICLQEKDTPLHHIKFDGYRQYLEFLKDPIVLALKNFRDYNGKTPLHKSIENDNLLLTEVLLTTDDVIRSIEDNEHNTAMDLLVKACRGNWEWDDMCERNGIIPGLQTTYFQDKTNLLEVRNTLSVVAALLATITFTAGFTLPGGVQSDSSGKPTLGNKAAFIVFLLADALAMCCSMLVLVCLLWSILCDHNRSLMLIDKSMPMLLVALYSTLVAFMTGVYVVIPHKSLWAAIVILVMCPAFIILSKRRIMYKLLDKLNPKMEKKPKDKVRLMEEGESTTLLGNRSSMIQKRASSSIGDSNPQQP